MSVNRQTLCRQLLKDSQARGTNIPTAVRQAMSKYKSCKHDLHKEASVNQNKACLPLFKESCASKPLRASKVVRATMASISHLLDELPNLKVIHLFRDPRGVVKSRLGISSTRGIYSRTVDRRRDRNESLIREAKIYCRNVIDDLNIKKTFKSTHADRILTVIYDDMVKNIGKYVEKIYNFLDMALVGGDAYDSVGVEVGVRRNRDLEHSRRPSDIATAWRGVLSEQTQFRILEVCEEFYQRVEYDWEL